ncbi:hypothetical protein DFJ58DRAFT_848065 [Suillus subalutaceus]|uniref:uncharacterized protein n=1 Tax=Suillus subalutaceus TaxID=48586 RepID=UPI001B885C2C|nr:uncharacterized protein DFJ58DRAFT_848065 [Suillus subalutaceus]KAG1832292.1 hypothetical protein DFJ58DRAFT_848065 [Suillus subalutaceus]
MSAPWWQADGVDAWQQTCTKTGHFRDALDVPSSDAIFQELAYSFLACQISQDGQRNFDRITTVIIKAAKDEEEQEGKEEEDDSKLISTSPLATSTSRSKDQSRNPPGLVAHTADLSVYMCTQGADTHVKDSEIRK